MGDKVHLLGDYGQQRQYDYPEQDQNYIGNKLDGDLRHGPIESRGCKDILFVLIYLGMWAVMVYCALIGHKEGNLSLIYQPYDSNQNHCGLDNVKDYPNVYLISPTEFYCVKSCPTEVNTKLDCYNNCGKSSPYPSKKVVTLCIPMIDDYQQYFGDAIALGGFQEHLADLEETWPIILACALIAFVISIILTFLIRFTASCIVWGMLFLYLLIVTLIGTVAYLQSTGEEFQEYNYIKDEKTLKGIAYVCWGVAVLSLLIILCLIRKINQAILILKTAAEFARETWQAMFVPFITFILISLFFAFWIIYSALIYSTSGKELNASNLHPYVELEWNTKTGWQLTLYFFALIWNICFSIALCQFVISSACCMWYYSHQGYDTSNSIIKGFCRALTTSFGSLLLGSLILAFVWMLQIVLEIVHKQLKNSVLGDNNQIGCFLKCCKYCVSYFERFIRFLNQNAYTMIALTGQSFCAAAYDAFYLIARNAIRVALTHGLGQIFEFIGSVFITAVTTMICYVIITESSYKNDIVSPTAPTIAFIIVSFVIGRMFMNIYGMGVDTLLLCYLVDYEMHKNEGGAKSVPNGFKQYVSEYH